MTDTVRCFKRDEAGDAIVEATILFPIMIMILAALVLIAMFLPAQAILQQSTQYAATALATEISDTWLGFDEDSMSYYWETNKDRLGNVYVNLFRNLFADVGDKGEKITEHFAARSIGINDEDPIVICYIDNKIVYKEVVVEAWRLYRVPVNLSFIGFPPYIVVSASSTAVVQNGDEFIRNMDIAADFAGYVIEKFGLSDIGDAIKSFGNEVKSLLFGDDA